MSNKAKDYDAIATHLLHNSDCQTESEAICTMIAMLMRTQQHSYQNQWTAARVKSALFHADSVVVVTKDEPAIKVLQGEDV